MGLSMRPAMFLAALFIALAVAELSRAAMLYGKAWLAPILIERAYHQGLATGEVRKPWPWADTHPVARLHVPRLALERFVLSGHSGHALAFAAGLAPGVRPGDPGLTMISGHRDTHFRFLSRIGRGDELTVSHGDRNYHYRVTDMVVADSRDGRIPATLPERGLLLVTCYPFDALVPGGPQRYVVVARQERVSANEEHLVVGGVEPFDTALRDHSIIF